MSRESELFVFVRAAGLGAVRLQKVPAHIASLGIDVRGCRESTRDTFNNNSSFSVFHAGYVHRELVYLSRVEDRISTGTACLGVLNTGGGRTNEITA